MSIPLAAAVIGGAMVLLVVVSMLLEQDGRVVQRLILGDRTEGRPDTPAVALAAVRPPADTPAVVALEAAAGPAIGSGPTDPAPTPTPETAPVEVPEVEPAVADAPVEVPASEEPAAEEPAAMAPAAGLRWGVLSTGPSSISLRDADVADTMSGVLFGAYVASGGPAAKRVSGWVSVRATPPSLDAEQFAPGADLRGKVGRVTAILDCDDLDATWVVLQPRVDIARGLVRSPVTDPVLEGLLVWWRAVRSLPTVLSAQEAGDLAASIAAIEERLADHPWSGSVARLRAALVDGVVNDREVLLGIAGGDELPAQSASERVSPEPTPAPRPTAPRS